MCDDNNTKYSEGYSRYIVVSFLNYLWILESYLKETWQIRDIYISQRAAKKFLIRNIPSKAVAQIKWNHFKRLNSKGVEKGKKSQRTDETNRKQVARQ